MSQGIVYKFSVILETQEDGVNPVFLTLSLLEVQLPLSKAALGVVCANSGRPLGWVLGPFNFREGRFEYIGVGVSAPDDEIRV